MLNEFLDQYLVLSEQNFTLHSYDYSLGDIYIYI